MHTIFKKYLRVSEGKMRINKLVSATVFFFLIANLIIIVFSILVTH